MTFLRSRVISRVCGCGARKDRDATMCRKCWREQVSHPPRTEWTLGARKLRVSEQGNEGRYA